MKLTTAVLTLQNDLSGFIPTMSGLGKSWDIIIPGEGNRWHHLLAGTYRETFSLSQINGNCGRLEIKHGGKAELIPSPWGSFSSGSSPERTVAQWTALLDAATTWLKTVHKDWIKANRRVQEQYPLRERYGLLPHALVRDSLPDAYRLDVELGAEDTAQFLKMVEDGYFVKSEHGVVTSMTATDFFNYCRIAYLAGKRPDETVDDSWTGRKMYERFADGRHDGLLDIDPESLQEFSDWIDGRHPKKGIGGHPWEIKRGGNTTHIDLMVYRPSHLVKEGFMVVLRAEAIHRMAEMIRMFLALHEAGLPITITEPENVRKRLLALDNIGIVPAYAPLRRANQQVTAADDVFEVMHYDELGRYKRRATPFITWKPLPLLRPRNPATAPHPYHGGLP